MKTAVEFLIEQLDNNLDINHSWRTRQYIEQAKEMFEKQFKYSFTKGMGFCEIYGSPEEEAKQDEIAKQLYNATFKQQEK